MNDTKLTKLYDQLTARERLTLLMSASERADAVERQRLLDSAPREHYAVPHHHALATALDEAATIHLLTLLDVAASYWQWWGMWGWQELSLQRQKVPDSSGTGDAGAPPLEDAAELRMMGMVRYQAFRFVTHWEGWRKFCSAWPIEASALLKPKPGWDIVKRTEAPAREHAYRPEEAALFLLLQRRLDEESAGEELELPQVVTVDGLAQVWHTLIDQQMEPHRGKGGC